MHPLTLQDSKPWVAMTAVWGRWRRRLLVFFAGQLSVQVLAFVTGLLVLRWMTEEEYAKTGVVLGFQAVFASFVDLGIGSSLVSLIGNRGHQPEVVGGYLAAARWWRQWLLAAVLPAGGIIFVYINARHGWPWQDSALLLTCMGINLYFAGMAAWASAPLLVHQRLGQLYAGSNAASITRLVGSAALHHADWLNAINVTMLGAAVSLMTAWMYRRAAARYVAEPERSEAAIRKEIGRFIAPLVPIAVFYALQGQISTLLIAYFGKATAIAEVTALGRLGQMFTFLGAIYGMLVAPYFARLPRPLLPGRYAAATIGTLLLAGLISACAFEFPTPLLWLLGPRYTHLEHEVGWMVLGSSLTFAGSAFWSIHSSLRWVFWWGTACYICSVTLTQIAFLAFVDPSSTLEVLRMSAATAGAALLTQAAVARMGFRAFAAQRVHPPA
jgi:O-antigen/teichoic acid export membrane protein